jgi:NifB/MoaA-like Fe-S oxidoreductase
MVALCSHYWGQSITVTGLLTGHDLLQKLQGKYLGDALLLPAIMLKNGDTCFLDDMTLAELADKVNTPVLPVRGVEELIETCVK